MGANTRWSKSNMYLRELLCVGLAIASGRDTDASAAERCFGHIVDCSSSSGAIDLFGVDR
jgi:hypothetical protein